MRQTCPCHSFSGQPFKWVEQYAAAGDYQVGFMASGPDGNSTQASTLVKVK